jgi:plasmid maintenance system antidote protein VapI
MNKLRPIHPGETLREEFLKPHGLSQSLLARSLGAAPAPEPTVALRRRSTVAAVRERTVRSTVPVGGGR